ncbi:MAG: hypothetical protein C6W59_01230 [Paenibacillaceae bacterium]|nr:MAG: hypothetical protein C6W59_01230 [Paenibacillaceae bacterium]
MHACCMKGAANVNNAADWFLMIAAGGLIAVWLFRRFYVWLHEPPASRVYRLGEGSEPDPGDETVRFLTASGYEVVSGKHRVPIEIEVDGELMQSRLFIDYVAVKDGRTWLVKTARDRMPIDWTGAGVRDKFLVYALLVPSAEGIVYADPRERWLRTITFAIGTEA